MGTEMDTEFAQAETAAPEMLQEQIITISNSSILNGLLQTVSGLLAVLNDQRQILSLNDSFMQMLGIDNPEEAFGLRPGKVLECVHANSEPSGCGTTKYCRTCGAAVAIVSCLADDQPVERTCAVMTHRDGTEQEKAFSVKAQPVTIDGHKFVLLFLQDITIEEQRAALSRTFFHDVSNMLYILSCNSELLLQKFPSEISTDMYHATQRVLKEVEIQRCLFDQDGYEYNPVLVTLSTEQVVSELKEFFKNHPAAKNQKIEYQNNCSDETLTTDFSLLQRVLCNMIINALEASGIKPVKFKAEMADQTIRFSVWNELAIEADMQKRIFTRNSSTKPGAGRGVGTFSMKLFGEKYLHGSVDFESSPEVGTTFTLTLPMQPAS